MSLPFSQTQCFFVAILVFIGVGLQRGWRRELVSLVFILLASFLVNQSTSGDVGLFLGRFFSALMNSPASQTAQATGFLAGPFWSLVIFVGLVVLGYYVGNQAFPKPVNAQERCIGVIPAVIGGAFVLGYLSNYFTATGGHVMVDVESPNPGNYITVIFFIVVVAIVVAVVASWKKTVKK
jgi:hypothetical protein